MLYTYSVVAYEALAAGVPPIFVRSETFLDLDQLEPNPDVRLVARTPEELRAADRTAAGLGDEWRARAREVVSAALEPPRDRLRRGLSLAGFVATAMTVSHSQRSRSTRWYSALTPSSSRSV